MMAIIAAEKPWSPINRNEVEMYASLASKLSDGMSRTIGQLLTPHAREDAQE